MKLYLIRHGETVDNVAGRYAGVRDSALTNHGFEQAQRLGTYFAQEKHVRFTHIFASPLTRAFKTAEAIQKAQLSSFAAAASSSSSPQTLQQKLPVVKVPDLIERDFGYYEGKPFSSRPPPEKSGVAAETEKLRKEPGFEDIESKEALAKRADAFLDQHLVPLLFPADGGEADERLVVAVVAHGMLLSHLWRRLLLRLPRKSLTLAPEVVAVRGDVVLEHLGGWSNTGYLELLLRKEDGAGDARRGAGQGSSGLKAALEVRGTTMPTPVPPSLDGEDVEVAVTATRNETADSKAVPKSVLWEGWSTVILAVDSKQHLVGLRRQRGGIGSSAHDEGQKKLDGFFKRQKLG